MMLTFVVIERGQEVLLRKLEHYKTELKDFGYNCLFEGSCRECKDFIAEMDKSVFFVEGEEND